MPTQQRKRTRSVADLVWWQRDMGSRYHGWAARANRGVAGVLRGVRANCSRGITVGAAGPTGLGQPWRIGRRRCGGGCDGVHRIHVRHGIRVAGRTGIAMRATSTDACALRDYWARMTSRAGRLNT